MPATLTVADVERIAALAHLELTDEEKLLFTRQLADILEYAQQLQSVDTTGVPAMAHVDAGRGVERDDEPRPSLPVADALANAPDPASDASGTEALAKALGAEASAKATGLFRVPRVIG